MDIKLAGVVLFLHIGIVICSFMIAGFLHVAFHALPRARTVAEMRPWAALMHRLEPLLPIFAVAILALGAWLVHLERGDGVSWSDGWVITPLITLIVLEALAGAVLAPRTKVLCERVAQAADGPVPEDIRRMTVNPVMWDVGHVATFGFFGIVFVMAAKPAGGIAWLFPVVGAVIGLVLSRLQLRSAAAAMGGGVAAAVPAQRDGVEAPAPADA
jgi:hypothetical protein